MATHSALPAPAPATARTIADAARALEQGRLVAFPTETVYGLGADAENPDAVARIYAAKGRPSNHPVIVHLAEGANAMRWVADMPDVAQQLMRAFWPGPLTLILKRAAAIPDAVSGGQDSIGLRCPSHPVAQALLRAFKQGQGGIAAPSANRFGHVSPTTARHVQDEFGDEPLIAAILDGGQSEVGIESTILDLSRLSIGVPPTLLRPGSISSAQIERVIGVEPVAATTSAPRASGTLDAHYAPQTPTVMVPSDRLRHAVTSLVARGQRGAALAFDVAAPLEPTLIVTPMSSDPVQYAHDLYAALRNADRCGADVILVEAPPATSEWSGVNDRLRRAAHASQALLAGLIGS